YKKLLALYHNKHIINEQSLEKVLKEEISLDEEGYRYECKTRGSRLIYYVKGYGQNESFKRAIIFSVNVAQSKLVFESRQNKVQFAEGIFVKYINSCLSKTASSIKGELV
ncbi:MAG TPA: hypothetical protein VM935_17085, partial [Chitinophagaceae bacterium]|nr:hypothetical protein [Chitinophagaceae bacterium]